MKVLLALLMLQFGPRPALSEPGIAQRDARRVEGAPLTPAETLLEPAILKAIQDAPIDYAKPAPTLIAGTDASAGEIVVVSPPGKGIGASWGLQQLDNAIASKAIARPSRSIRFLSTPATSPPQNTKAAIFVVDFTTPTFQIVRGLWSTAALGDEVVEVFSRQTALPVEAVGYRDAGQPKWDAFGVPTTTIFTGEWKDTSIPAAFVVAASAYFLATLPNTGAEALLSHLTVGAHARLAEDGRKAVAQMGNQQRASADVLIMFGQAIEREQRRIRSFERFMPAPVDPMLRSRLADMEKAVTSVWTSMGITSSPFVPAAERIRGRGGEDRRVPTRTGTGPLPKPEPPTAFLKFPNVDDVIDELGNFIDGQRSISDIRDALSAEFAPIALPVVADYFERLAKANAVSLR